MAGTKIGGKRCAQTNIERYGKDYYSKLGRKGGKAKHTKPRGFAANPALAVTAGAIGGHRSKRGPAKNKKTD